MLSAYNQIIIGVEICNEGVTNESIFEEIKGLCSHDPLKPKEIIIGSEPPRTNQQNL